MIFSKKLANWQVLSSIAMILVILALASCGTGGTGSTVTPTPQPPTPTPLPNVLTQTFTGKDFTIKYPTDWKTTGDSPIIISDALAIYDMTITSIANPNGIAATDKMLDGGISGIKGTMKSSQAVTMPATVIINGQTWSQRAISGTAADGQEVEFVFLGTNHPDNSPNTKGYVVFYGTAKAQFDDASTKYFMPMLQSFKFNA